MCGLRYYFEFSDYSVIITQARIKDLKTAADFICIRLVPHTSLALYQIY